MRRCIPYIEVAMAMLIMGTSVVATKIIVGKFPTFLASCLRLTLSAVLQFLLLWMIREPLPKLTRREKGVLVSQAFLGVFLYSICFLEGLRRTTALESSIFSSFIPAAGGLIAVIIFHEKLTKGQGVGIFLTVAGTLLINIFGGSSGGVDAGRHLLGNGLILLSAVCQAVFVTFGKLVYVHPIFLGASVSALGAGMLAPFAIRDLLRFDLSSVTLPDWGWIFYMGFICTGLGVMLMNHGNKRISPSSVSVFTALNPVSAILISFLVLREPMSWGHVLGMAVIFAGIFCSLFLNSARKAASCV